MGGGALLSAGLSAGAGLAGGLMGGGKGGGGGGVSVQSNPMQDIALAKQMQLMEKYDQQTEGFRQGLMSDYGQLRAEDFDPTNLPMYKPIFGLQKKSLESQYQQAKDQIMGKVAPGGTLAGAVTNLEANRASTMGALPAQVAIPLVQDIRTRAETAGFNMPQVVLGGGSSVIGSLGNQQAASIAAAANQYATDQSIYNAALGGVGQGIGKGISRGIGKAART